MNFLGCASLSAFHSIYSLSGVSECVNRHSFSVLHSDVKSIRFSFTQPDQGVRCSLVIDHSYSNSLVPTKVGTKHSQLFNSSLVWLAYSEQNVVVTPQVNCKICCKSAVCSWLHTKFTVFLQFTCRVSVVNE